MQASDIGWGVIHKRYTKVGGDGQLPPKLTPVGIPLVGLAESGEGGDQKHKDLNVVGAGGGGAQRHHAWKRVKLG